MLLAGLFVFFLQEASMNNLSKTILASGNDSSWMEIESKKNQNGERILAAGLSEDELQDKLVMQGNELVEYLIGVDLYGNRELVMWETSVGSSEYYLGKEIYVDGIKETLEDTLLIIDSAKGYLVSSQGQVINIDSR